MPLTVDPGYVTWCDQCNWNVQLTSVPRSSNRFEMLYASLGRRFGLSLFNEIKQNSSLKPWWTLTRFTAWVLALSVHSLTVALFLLGIILILNNYGSCLSLFSGVVCFGLAWILRPQPAKLPANVEITPRERAPVFYRHIDQISTALRAPRVDGVVITADFNAAYLTVGWRRQRILMLGLPLLSVLTPQERVAVMAHELAHSVNGDPARGLVIGTALNTLARWYFLLRPTPMYTRPYGLLEMFADSVLTVLSLFPWVAAQALIHLLYRDSQRAEYLADRLSAHIGGTNAVVSALDKMRLTDSFVLCVRRSTLNSSTTNFFTEFHRQVTHVPPRELERIRRAERLYGSRLSMTHPPTVYRIDALQAHPVTAPQVTCGTDISLSIEQELSAFKEDVERELKRRYEAVLNR